MLKSIMIGEEFELKHPRRKCSVLDIRIDDADTRPKIYLNLRGYEDRCVWVSLEHFIESIELER